MRHVMRFEPLHEGLATTLFNFNKILGKLWLAVSDLHPDYVLHSPEWARTEAAGYW